LTQRVWFVCFAIIQALSLFRTAASVQSSDDAQPPPATPLKAIRCARLLLSDDVASSRCAPRYADALSKHPSAQAPEGARKNLRVPRRRTWRDKDAQSDGDFPSSAKLVRPQHPSCRPPSPPTPPPSRLPGAWFAVCEHTRACPVTSRLRSHRPPTTTARHAARFC